MLSAIWAKITGKDKRKQYPDQQASALGRLGDYTIVYPYGMHCDLPSDTLLRVIAPGIAIPVTVKRPSDGAQGEPMFFHPESNTRIIARNNGDLDIFTNGDVNHVVTGDYKVTADKITLVSTAGTLTHNGKNVGDTHTHNGSPTAPDGPVSNTGQPV